MDTQGSTVQGAVHRRKRVKSGSGIGSPSDPPRPDPATVAKKQLFEHVFLVVLDSNRLGATLKPHVQVSILQKYVQNFLLVGNSISSLLWSVGPATQDYTMY